MTLRVTIDWKIHKTCLWIFSTFEFSLFFQIWSSLEKQKYGFLLTRGKKCIFLYSQNMKSISEAWINSHMKVRFLGLWKMYFFKNFDKNIHGLYYGENQYFWFNVKFYSITVTNKSPFFGYSLFSILFEKTTHKWCFTRVYYKFNFLKFHFIEDILQLKNYYMLLKKAWASTFWGGGQFAAFYRNVELVAKLDYCDWNYAVDEYCNFMITIKNGFSSEKNYS